MRLRGTVMNDFECAIGLEVHVELNTATKAFCSCSTRFGDGPNTHVCPVCLGHPGALPSLNAKVTEKAVAAGLALNCRISEISRFDRKNYFYPDLPKSYQITQFFHPICRDGFLAIETDGGEKKIEIERIHIEEDAGKLSHREDRTEIDYNRCGVPLLEIVTRPQISSSDELKQFLKKLRSVMLFTKVSDCKMNEGSIRCDVNVSVRKKGDGTSGTPTEIKNLNSFKFAARAAEYEISRQIAVISGGGTVEKQTMRYNTEKGITEPMRSKENAEDYRYFPEPDLPPLHITEECIEEIRKTLPILPDVRIRRYERDFGIPAADGETLTRTPELSAYFESVAEICKYPNIAANFLLSEVPSAGDENSYMKIPPKNLAALSELFGNEEISSATAKKLLRRMIFDGIDPRKTVAEESLRQINDREAVRKYAEAAIEQSPKALADYKKGKLTAAAAVVGRAMANSGGKLNPVVLSEICAALLKEVCGNDVP